MTHTDHSFRGGLTRGRLLVLALLVSAVAVFPANAQADPVTDQESGCTVQLEFQGPPTNSVRFTYRDCEFPVNEIEGAFDRPASFFPPAIVGTAPPTPFVCEDPGAEPPADPQSVDFTCEGAPGSTAGEGSISVPPGENPCEGNLLQINFITFRRADNPLTPENEAREATVGQGEPDIFTQGCPGGAGAAGEGGGGDDEGSERECPPGTERRRVDGDDGDSSTQHSNEERDTGEPEGEHSESGGDSGSDEFVCSSGKGKPKGGVQAGSAAEVQRVSSVGDSPTPLLAVGGSMLLVGLVGGGLALARRRS